MRISTEPFALIALNNMEERTFVAAFLLPQSPLEPILSHPILLLKPDSLPTDPLSNLSHFIWVVEFKNSGSTDDIDGVLLSFLLLRGNTLRFSRLFVGVKEEPIEVFGSFGFLLRLDNMAFVEIGEFTHLRTHLEEILSLECKILLCEAAQIFYQVGHAVLKLS
jgi:hypothetical protein